MTFGTVILAGGKSSRMGRDKGALDYGGQSFLEKIAGELSEFDEKLLSVADKSGARLAGFTQVADVYKDCGPMAGLCAALSVCRSDALLAVSCDLPLFTKELGDYLISTLPGWDAVVPMTGERKHPLCAVYKKESTAVFARCLDAGDRRLQSALSELHTNYVPLTGAFADILLKNINTPEEYRSLSDGKARP